MELVPDFHGRRQANREYGGESDVGELLYMLGSLERSEPCQGDASLQAHVSRSLYRHLACQESFLPTVPEIRYAAG